MPDIAKLEPDFCQRRKGRFGDAAGCLSSARLVIAVAAPALAEHIAMLIAQQGIGFASSPIDPQVVSQWSSLLKFCELSHPESLRTKLASKAYAKSL
ncbi:hypothetical protein D3C81_1941070 [compost metagenome]